MPSSTLNIFFHNHCFDGVASAALFAEFYKQTQNSDAVIRYIGMTHSQEDPFASVNIDANENACLDFRYCSHPKMNWWFDHHASAFQPAELEAHYKQNSTEKKFYDPKARSCALFMRAILEEKYNFNPSAQAAPLKHWDELLQWADRIDGALFESAEAVVRLESPALKLMTWLRSTDSEEKIIQLIPSLGQMSLASIVDLPWIQEELVSILDRHQVAIESIKNRLRLKRGVATYDLSNDPVHSHNSFIAYMVCPESTYSVGLVDTGFSASISVGRNPWADTIGTKNIAEVCEKYGGGGHPHVGGISLNYGQLERARQIMDEIQHCLES